MNKIVLTYLTSARPNSYARLYKFVFGAVKLYDKSNSNSLEVVEQADCLNERAPTNTMRFKVNNFAREFNVLDPTGIYQFFQYRQVLNVKIGAKDGGNTYKVNMGDYYLQSPRLSGNTKILDFSATNILGLMQETTFNKGVFKTATIQTFVNDIINDFGDVLVEMPASFGTTTVSAYLQKASHAELLRQIALAMSCFLTISRDGKVVFKELGSVLQQTFTKADYNLNNGFQPNDDEVINTINVGTSEYVQDTIESELANFTTSGVHKVEYDPSVNQRIEITNGTIVASSLYVDNAEIETTGGTVTNNMGISKKKVNYSGNNKRLIDREFSYE